MFFSILRCKVVSVLQPKFRNPTETHTLTTPAGNKFTRSQVHAWEELVGYGLPRQRRTWWHVHDASRTPRLAAFSGLNIAVLSKITFWSLHLPTVHPPEFAFSVSSEFCCGKSLQGCRRPSQSAEKNMSVSFVVASAETGTTVVYDETGKKRFLSVFWKPHLKVLWKSFQVQSFVEAFWVKWISVLQHKQIVLLFFGHIRRFHVKPIVTFCHFSFSLKQTSTLGQCKGRMVISGLRFRQQQWGGGRFNYLWPPPLSTTSGSLKHPWTCQLVTCMFACCIPSDWCFPHLSFLLH